ncbi:hypothetical protein L249_4751 [Ophiocordyceps polyrhachis-furcata BCC 54312]|uniref:F-box domain-containing protein n=1 Tax=Ophiocordyceps polyrhachis-furcata BCC 54312 TaxID=1330021 RepID=A0A367L2C1_9HYPO|nr:hypothetical protein L249_4751 [Ophiocordyceps polyrhachis-furcata BCC 54312]
MSDALRCRITEPGPSNLMLLIRAPVVKAAVVPSSVRQRCFVNASSASMRLVKKNTCIEQHQTPLNTMAVRIHSSSHIHTPDFHQMVERASRANSLGLPTEVIIQIFKHLCPIDKLHLALPCKRLAVKHLNRRIDCHAAFDVIRLMTPRLGDNNHYRPKKTRRENEEPWTLSHTEDPLDSKEPWRRAMTITLSICPPPSFFFQNCYGNFTAFVDGKERRGYTQFPFLSFLGQTTIVELDGKKSTFVESSIALSALEQRYASEKAKLNPARTTTQAQKSKSLLLIQQLVSMREKELAQEHAATTPSHQFRAQVQAEARARNNGAPCPVAYRDIIKPTKPSLQPIVAAIKERWVKQGIWKPEWSVLDMPGDQWKHETGPVHVHPAERRVDTAAHLLRSLREPGNVEQVQQGLNRLELADAESDAAHLLMAMKDSSDEWQEREASRPLFQFVLQFCQERCRLAVDGTAASSIDVMAYDQTKQTWIENGLWDKNWGLVPGMAWKHERPLGEFLLDDAAFVEACRLAEAGATLVLCGRGPLYYDINACFKHLTIRCTTYYFLMRLPPAYRLTHIYGL